MRYDPWMRLKEDLNPILADLQGAFNDEHLIDERPKPAAGQFG
ncbi:MULTISPECIES: hypothetical protein [unclassified Sphingobacterium]|nr:hypothetical protein [Sphingobacterium sp. UBA5670]